MSRISPDSRRPGPLQINDQAIPGRKARAVMKYWESLTEDTTLSFSILRNDEVIPLIID